MRKLLLSMLALGSFCAAQAQVSITSMATPYTQNFDGLSNDTVFTNTHAMTLTGWAIFEKGTGTAADQLYKVSRGTNNNGETYSYGDTLATDRALGSLASASNLPSYGIGFQNNTGASITNFNVSYHGEQWRSGDTTAASLDSLVFEYSTTATGINDTTATWNPVYSLMLNTINLTTVTVGALDGNAAGNTNTVTGSFSVLVANGSKIYFRWRDINKVASDDGLAIDDLSVSFSSSGNPKPVIVSLTPADNATMVSPATSAVSMTFDQPVTLGTGNITLYNLSDATSQIIACGSTSIAGAVVTVSGVNLLAGKQYAVQFDSTCYQSAASANSYGIYDNTTWNFATMPNGVVNMNQPNLDINGLPNGQVVFHLPHAETMTFTVQDINGRTIETRKVNAQSGVNTLDMSWNHAQGIYFLQLKGEQHYGVLKVSH